MRKIVQFCLFDEPEVVAEVRDKDLSHEANRLIKACAGLSEYEQEKVLRLSREWIRQEVSRFFGFTFQRMKYDYPPLIRKITQYNNK